MTAGDWPLRDFELRFDEWRLTEPRPPREQVIAVFAWIESLRLNPYPNAKPIAEIGLPWWFARIPQSEHNGTVVVCTMRIDEDRLESVCSHFATLTLPL